LYLSSLIDSYDVVGWAEGVPVVHGVLDGRGEELIHVVRIEVDLLQVVGEAGLHLVEEVDEPLSRSRGTLRFQGLAEELIEGHAGPNSVVAHSPLTKT